MIQEWNDCVTNEGTRMQPLPNPSSFLPFICKIIYKIMSLAMCGSEEQGTTICGLSTCAITVTL